MAYLQHSSWKDRPGAVAGVIGIHALIGYALVTGLNFTKFVETVQNPKGIFVPEVKLPPPPPKPEPRAEPESKMTQPAHQPKPKLDVSSQRPPIDSTPEVVPVPDPIPYVVPKPTAQPGITPQPVFDPTSARPRGNPGLWVTVDDYRSSWINQEKTGTVRFRLEVGVGGRVENCTITASSGHPELDAATCKLVAARAKFEPAKDGTGTKVSGSYSNAVRWELPD